MVVEGFERAAESGGWLLVLVLGRDVSYQPSAVSFQRSAVSGQR
jgi:hypothetical protein